MLEEAEKLPIEYDEDCPKLTPEQLAQFRPVNYVSMEERAQAMRQEAELLAGFRQLGPSDKNTVMAVVSMAVTAESVARREHAGA